MKNEKYLNKVPLYLSVVTAATGLAVLGGWIFDIGMLKSVLPGLVAMKANTAAGFLASGLALLLLDLRPERGRFRLIVGIGSAFVSLLGLATLSQYLFGWNLGIDQLLFKEPPGAVFTTHLGRMAPPTAFNFALIGLALFLSSFDRRSRLCQSLALIAGLVGLMSMLGYLIGNQAIYFFPSWTQMALHTAICFILFSVGILMRHYRLNPNAILGADPAYRSVGLGFSLVFFILLVVGMISIQSVTMMGESVHWVEHTHQGIQTLEQYRASLKTVESAQRGYAISGRADFLKRYQTDLEESARLLAQLKELTKDNQGQQRRLDGLDSLTRGKTGFSLDVIATRQRQGGAAAAALIASGAGQRLMSRIDAVVDSMHWEEARLLSQRRDQIGRTLAITIAMTLLGGLLAVIVIVLSGCLIIREMKARSKAEQALQAANEELEASNQQLNAANQELSAMNQELTAMQEELEHHRDQLQVMVNEATAEIQENYKSLKAEAEVRKLAEIKIIESEQKFRQLAENIDTIFWITDWVEKKLLFVNQAYEKVFGLTTESAYSDRTGWKKAVHPDDLERVSGELQSHAAKGEFTELDYRIFCKGKTKWIHERALPVKDETGLIVRYINVAEDITERKQTENIQQALYKISDAAIGCRDLQQLYIQIHKIIAKLLPAENLYISLYDDKADIVSFPYYKDQKKDQTAPRKFGKGLTEYIIATQKPLLMNSQVYEQLLREGKAEVVDQPSKQWLGVPLMSENKAFGVLVVQSYDEKNEYTKKDLELLNFVARNVAVAISSIQANQMLQLAAKKWETTFDSIGDGICLLDRQGKVLQCNRAFSRLVKKPFEDILGRGCHELAHGQDHPLKLCPITRMENSHHRESQELAREGKTLLMAVDPIFDENKNLAGAVHTIFDISERKLIEQELLQAQKMEAVGFLAGGVAHDFNNMLAGIVGNAELLLLKIYGQKELEAYVDNIIKASGHAAGLTKQLLAFARKGQYQRVPVNVHKIIAETLGILGSTIDRRIKIEQHLRADPAVILGDYSQLENALMNLGINARDAMPDGGKLIFSTDLVTLDQEYISQHNYKIAPGPYIRISVDDTGSGMTDEVKSHLFEPFFTTKEKGKGTGLGLAGIYGCVKNHGGSIEVYSELGRGTSVKIYLPLYGDPGALDQGSDQLQYLPATAGTGSILIVDDEDMIRTIAAQILKTAGYQVKTCADGQEAVELYAKEHRNIDLVIMDMVMPRLDGREAFVQMSKINPKVRMLLSSGFSEDGDAQAILKDGAMGFIQKPYRSAELLARVQQALQLTKNNNQ